MLLLRKLSLAVLLVYCTFTVSLAQIDPTFAPTFVKIGSVRSLAFQSDGKIIVSGDFTRAGSTVRNKLFRLHADGSLDSSFDSGLGYDNEIFRLLPLANGKIMIAGSFTKYNNIEVRHLARLNSDGSLDTSFNAGGNGPNQPVYSMALRKAGGFYIKGFFSLYNNANVKYLIAIDEDGVLDITFDENASTYVSNGGCSNASNLQVFADGKIIAADCSNTSSGVAKLNADGTKDVSFTFPTDIAFSSGKLILQPDGKFILAGSFRQFEGSSSVSRIARFNNDGTKDDSFTTVTSIGTVFDIALTPTGKLMVAAFNSGVRSIVRLHDNGEVDGTFSAVLFGESPDSPQAELTCLAINAPDGRMWVGGRNLTIATRNEPLILLEANGALSSVSIPLATTPANIYDATLDNAGNILVVGDFTHVNNLPKRHITRIKATGEVDQSFTPVITNIVSSFYYQTPNAQIRTQSNGKIIVASPNMTVTGIPGTTSLVRLNISGTLDATFTGLSTGTNPVQVFEIRADDKILIGGDFISDSTPGNLVMLNANGSIDPGFVVSPATLDFRPTTIHFLPDNSLIVGGERYESSGSSSTGKIIALSSTGTLKPDFKWIGNAPTLKTSFIPRCIAKSTTGFIVGGRPASSYSPSVKDLVTSLDNYGNTIPKFSISGTGIIYTRALLTLTNGITIYGGDSYFPASNALRFINSNGARDLLPIVEVNGEIAKILQLSPTKILVLGDMRMVEDQSIAGAFVYSIPTVNPGVISNLQASIAEESNVSLTWEYTGHSAFEIFRATKEDEPFIKIGTSALPSFVDRKAVSGSTNVFKVRSINESGPGAFSSPTSIALSIETLAPPIMLKAALVSNGNNTVALSWLKSDSYSSLDVERVEDPNDLSKAVNYYINGLQQSTTIVNQEPNKTYYFRIRGVKDGKKSAYTDYVEVTTVTPTLLPPENLSASVQGNQVLLTWGDPSSLSESFEIYRAPVGYSYYSLVATVSDTSFIDTGATASSTHLYVVRSIMPISNFMNTSEYSNVAEVELPNFDKGTWTTKASLPVARYNATAFSIGKFGYVGLGYNATFLKDFYKFDPTANSWTSIATFPGAVRSDAFSFVIGGIAYVGGGNAGSNTGLKDFYAYNPVSNTWTQLADIPNDDAGNVGILSSVSFTLSGKGYVTMIARTGGVLTRELWEYTPGSNQWTKRLDFPGSLQREGIAVANNDNAFVGLGGVLSLSAQWWRYNAKTNTWTKENDSTRPRKSSVAVNYAGKLLGIGGDVSTTMTPDYVNTVMVYYAVNQFWASSSLPPISGSRSNAVALTIGDRLYTGTGYNGAVLSDFQEFKPTKAISPGMVSDLQALYRTDTESDLVWKTSNLVATSLHVELSDDGVSYTTKANLSITDTTFRFTGLQANKRYYARVKTSLIDTEGTYNTISFFTTNKPAPPTDLSAGSETSSSITLTWTDASDNETGFEIWRVESYLYDPLYVKVGLAPSNAQTFTDSNDLTPGTDYYYKIRAINEAGVSTFTTYVKRTTQNTPPPTPTQVEVSKITNRGATLKWQYNLEDAVSGAALYYSKVSGTQYSIMTVFNPLVATLTTLEANTKYYVAVKLINADKYSDFSTEVSFTTLEEFPVEPTNLVGKAITDTSIELTWDYTTPTFEDGFIIQRALDTGGSLVYSTLDTVAIPIRKFLDTTVDKFSKYSYRLFAFSTGGNSITPAIVNVIALPFPDKPTNLLLSRPTLNSVKIKWTDNASNEEGYIIQQKIEADGTFVVIDTLEANTTSFVHANLSPDLPYTYTVTAFNLAGSTLSDPVSIAVLTAPLAPANLVASRDSITRVKLVWSDRMLNEDGYIVRTFDFTANEFIPLDTLPPNTTSYLHPELFEQRIYRYQVVAFNLLGEATSTTVEVLNLILGIEEEEKTSVYVYPNPGKGQYTVEVAAPRWEITILTSVGSILSTTSESGFTKELDIHHLPDGVYYLSIKVEDKITTVRVVKTAE